MNIARMEKFEALWSARHDLPAESLAQYRFESREGYSLPELAAHYRTYCDVLESIQIDLPKMIYWGTTESMEGYDADDIKEAIEAAGLKVAG